MDVGMNDTAYDANTTQFMDVDYDFEEVNGCGKIAFKALNHASGVVPAIGIVLTICTMIIIARNHRLRRKRNVFPFNIVLADFVLDAVLFADYVKWELGVMSNNDAWKYAIGIPYRATHMVSTGSIFLVAIDQLIAFKIDSFGSRNILTKCRCIFLCVALWVVMLVVSTCINVWATDPKSVRFVLSNLALVLTGVCYFLVYKTISKSQLGGGHQLQERRKENQRVLTTYILILGTTLLLFTLPDLVFFLLYDLENKFFPSCVFFGWYILQTLNTITNCFIYWWRLKDFRAIIAQKIRHMQGIGRFKTSLQLNTIDGCRVNILSKQFSNNNMNSEQSTSKTNVYDISEKRASTLGKIEGQFDSHFEQIDCPSAQMNGMWGQTEGDS
nr:uncharacterized protein LOC129281468 [Lytechinus pictus]